MFSLFDKPALWISDNWTPAWQMRTGMAMVYQAIGFILYMPFSGEQVGIFLMSAFSLLYGGPNLIATARLAMDQAETDQDIEELKHDDD